MLSLMRKHAGSWLIKVALGAIVVVFVFWGVGSYREQRKSRIAVVNGTAISLGEYRSVHDQLMEQYRRQFGGVLDEKFMETLGLRKKALDQLINRRLLLQEASRLKLRVTKEELAGAIRQVPAFQTNGQFDPKQYQRVLARNRMNPEMYEEGKKEELLLERLQGLVLGGVKVSDSEALENFKWLEERVSLDYVAFAPSSYEDVKVTQEEIKSYFSGHKNSYKTPPRVKIQYLRFGFKEFESQAEVSEEEITRHFEVNRKDYATPKKLRARHILFRVAPDAKKEETEDAHNKALKVLNQARSGADFAGLARKYSDDPGSKSKGGDLGFFTKDEMVKPFSDAAFAMKQGEISEPVKTPFGWHLIKVEAVQEAKKPALSEAADKIRTKLLKEAARNIAYDQAEEIYEACYGAEQMADVAAGRQLKVRETGFFSRTGPVDGIKEAGKVAKVSFELGDNVVSEPLELADGYYIVCVIDRKAAEIPKLEAVEEKVRHDLLRTRQEELAKKDAEAFLSAIKKGAEFQKEADSRKLKAKSTDFFKRFASIPELDFGQGDRNIAFSLSPSNPLPESVIKGRQGYYVIRLKDRQQADPAQFEARKSEIKSRVMFQKQQKLMEEWFARLRQDSEIMIEEGFLD
ncbi:MAG: SurA N-terminal domain-containing protein [Desulfobacterales bacterium]|nr:SurA N-terminal domain-containing protein [Desulfobacterales bacterium]